MGIRLTPVVVRSRAGRWALSVLAILWAVAAAVVLQSQQASRLWYRLVLCANLGLPVAAWFALH